MTNDSKLQPLALGTGWIIEKNEFLKTVTKEILLPFENHSSKSLLLVLKYKHCERKRKFSFQDYELSILLEYFKGYSEEYFEDSFKELFERGSSIDNYLISVFVKPCSAEGYFLNKTLCTDSQSTAEKINYLANRYSSPYNWSKEQIKVIYKIWEKERIARKIKSMMPYHGTDAYVRPIDFIPIRIPAGWNILLNSFSEKDIFVFPVRQQCNIKNFKWERDISAYMLELNKVIVYVELQEYMNEDGTSSLLHVYVYYDLKENNVFFEKLEGIFCYSVEDAKKELEEMLWKWQLSEKTQIEKEAGKFYNAEKDFEQ